MVLFSDVLVPTHGLWIVSLSIMLLRAGPPSWESRRGVMWMCLHHRLHALLQSCWTPILKALAESVDDPRLPVRAACVSALCMCVQDRHATAVPTGVLVDVLGNLMSPVVIRLANILQADITQLMGEKNALSALSMDADDTERAIVSIIRSLKSGNIAPVVISSASSNAIDNVQRYDIVVCLEAMSAVFTKHLKRLLLYPTFDKLWLRLLYVLGYFIGSHTTSTSASVTGIDTRLLSIVDLWSTTGCGLAAKDDDIPMPRTLIELKVTREFCIERLASLIKLLSEERIFEIRHGLGFVTKETVKQLRNVERIDLARWF
jgi:hypothetical protein